MMTIYEDFINIIGHSCLDLVWYVSLDDMEIEEFPTHQKTRFATGKFVLMLSHER